MENFKGFIAVHIGAGFHSQGKEKIYKNICRRACIQATRLLRRGFSAEEAVVAAIKCLENFPETNAGLGSNLSIRGNVECDASIMSSRSLQFGACGAVSGVKNPIELAHHLLKTQEKGLMLLGRVPPWRGGQAMGSGASLSNSSKATTHYRYF